MYENSPIKASLTASMMVLVHSLNEATNANGNTVAEKISSVDKHLKPYIATIKEYNKQVSKLRAAQKRFCFSGNRKTAECKNCGRAYQSSTRLDSQRAHP